MDENQMKTLVDSINTMRGNSQGWPACFEYGYDNNEKRCEITFFQDFQKKNFRRVEPWGLAFMQNLKDVSGDNIHEIVFKVNCGASSTENPKTCKHAAHCKDFCVNVEALRRRVSFLALNNKEISFKLSVKGKELPLDSSVSTLFTRPEDEIIRPDYSVRGDKDEPGRLEKDFQTFLFGKGLNKDGDERTNERLAILGKDFFNLNRKNYALEREFPTGVFKKVKSAKTRVLPTEYIDIVTINKHKMLSIIELKLNDSQLEVISQLLDYALFFRSYIGQLKPVLDKRFGKKIKAGNIICYVANNSYHLRFNSILKYYSTEDKGYGFELKRIILGETGNI